MSKFAICIFAGEDYLYPKKYFVFIPFSREIEKVLLQTV